MNRLAAILILALGAVTTVWAQGPQPASKAHILTRAELDQLLAKP